MDRNRVNVKTFAIFNIWHGRDLWLCLSYCTLQIWFACQQDLWSLVNLISNSRLALLWIHLPNNVAEPWMLTWAAQIWICKWFTFWRGYIPMQKILEFATHPSASSQPLFLFNIRTHNCINIRTGGRIVFINIFLSYGYEIRISSGEESKNSRFALKVLSIGMDLAVNTVIR
jgi:hypothetical protein